MHFCIRVVGASKMTHQQINLKPGHLVTVIKRAESVVIEPQSVDSCVDMQSCTRLLSLCLSLADKLANFVDIEKTRFQVVFHEQVNVVLDQWREYIDLRGR